MNVASPRADLRVAELLGRDDELARLYDLIDGIGQHGGALVVRGEPGIGKSALLDVARRTAVDRELAVLTTGGVQSEARLAFAGLHRLLRTALDELDRLPDRQRRAIEVAFGLADGAAPDTFLIALAALDLLAEMAADAPLVVLVEDADWLDAASRDVLTFVARRVELEPVVMVFAAREEFSQASDLPVITLAGLDEEASAALLDRTAPDLAPDLRRRILAEAAGNPLALGELPRALHANGSDGLALQLPLPLTERLERSFAARAAHLPWTTRAPLLIAALEEGGELPRLFQAASELAGRTVEARDYATAAEAGLVSLEESGIRFRHPLIRSAIYQNSSLAERQAAHSALATAYADDPDRSVWHRAAATVGPDEDLVDELEQTAARAERRGAPAGTAAALERAADLTSDDTRRGSLLLRAAELETEIGRNEVALGLLRKARTFDLDSRRRLNASYLSELLEGGWSGAEHVASFAEVAEELEAAGEKAQALEALEATSLRAWWGNPEQATRDRIVAVAERLGLADEDPRLLAILAGADPVNRGRVVLERYARASELAAGNPVAMVLVAHAVASVWAPNLSLPLCTMAVDGLRAQGRLAAVARVLVVQAWAAVHVADARVATPAAAEGARLSVETGQPRWTASALLAQATMAAERGDLTGAEQLAARAEGVLLPMGANPMLSMVQFARGRAAVAQGRYSDAYEQLRRVFDRADIAHHPFVGGWAVADFVDAAVHGGGSVDAAVKTLTDYERIATLTLAPLLRAQVAFARPLIASASDAEPLFQTALQDELSSWPCYRGRLLLAYGSWLRRQRRAADSRVPLRAAAEAFDALGFAEMSERSRQELRASGETGRPRVAEAWNRLSPQELQIARMAAAGMTNRQIGEKLYLSHRTIGSHLYRIFPKLGITSRAELRDALEAAPGAWRENSHST